MSPSRRLSIALLASLALNLFLGGMLTSQWIFAERHGRPHHVGRFDREGARAAIDEQYRAAVDAIWRRHKKALRGRFREMREVRRRLRQELLAEEFDQAALARTYEELHARGLAARNLLGKPLAEIAAALPAEQRKRYFQAGFARAGSTRPGERRPGRGF